MKAFHFLAFVSFVVALSSLPSVATAEKTALREVIVSHTDPNGILQLYRMKEDGTDRQQLTQSSRGCRMPACSPDGRKLAYIEHTEQALSLVVSDIDGKNARVFAKDGRHRIPSWLPDSRHLVWMESQPGQTPTENSQIHLLNTDTGESRRLFTDPEQLKFSNGMPVVSPRGGPDRFRLQSKRDDADLGEPSGRQ